jgi:hypothetical protein
VCAPGGYGRLQTIKKGLPVDGRARHIKYVKGLLLCETDAAAGASSSLSGSCPPTCIGSLT